MSWIGISDGQHWLTGEGPASPGENDTLLPRGSLLIEVALRADEPQAFPLIDYLNVVGWRRYLWLGLNGDLLQFELEQGPAKTRASLEFARPAGDCTLRIALSWDAPRKWGVLALDCPEHGISVSVPLGAPPPIPMADLMGLTGASVGPLSMLAWSDEAEPVGPTPGLTAGTPVETRAGTRRIEEIEPGDLVRTLTGFQPVRHVVSRMMPAIGDCAPVLLAAHSLGLTEDLLVAPDHRLLIGGADAEYLFGVDAVLVEARHLRRISGVPLGRNLRRITYHQIIFDRHECIRTAGVWSESQYVPTGITMEPTMFAECQLRGLKSHDDPANPLLMPYEAAVLISALTA